jgi:hypothetical protein
MGILWSSVQRAKIEGWPMIGGRALHSDQPTDLPPVKLFQVIQSQSLAGAPPISNLADWRQKDTNFNERTEKGFGHRLAAARIGGSGARPGETGTCVPLPERRSDG